MMHTSAIGLRGDRRIISDYVISDMPVEQWRVTHILAWLRLMGANVPDAILAAIVGAKVHSGAYLLALDPHTSVCPLADTCTPTRPLATTRARRAFQNQCRCNHPRAMLRDRHASGANRSTLLGDYGDAATCQAERSRALFVRRFWEVFEWNTFSPNTLAHTHRPMFEKYVHELHMCNEIKKDALNKRLNDLGHEIASSPSLVPIIAPRGNVVRLYSTRMTDLARGTAFGDAANETAVIRRCAGERRKDEQ